MGPSVDLARVEPIVAAAEKAKSREGDEMNVKRTFNEQQPMMMMHSMSMHENLGRLLLKREGVCSCQLNFNRRTVTVMIIITKLLIIQK